MLLVDRRAAIAAPDTRVGEKYETLGAVGEVIERLHPEARGLGIGPAIAKILQALGDQELFFRSPFHDGAQLFLTGSEAKRFYGGTPGSWYRPGNLWHALAEADPSLANNDTVQSLTHGGRWDTDVRFVLKQEAEMGDVHQVVASVLPALPCSASMEVRHHGVSSQLRVLLGGKYHLDLGALPDYRQRDAWDIQIHDDARTSHILPWRVFAPYCPITDGGLIQVDTSEREAFWLAPYYSGGAIYGSGLDGALVAWFRSKVTDEFWPPKRHMTGVPSYYEAYTHSEFWSEVRQNSIGRENRLADRAPEIAVQALLLLTLDPDAGLVMMRDGVLDHLQLGQQWDGNGLPSISEYKTRMADDSLPYTDIGPVQLAKHLGLSMKELIGLCQPVM